MTDRKIILAISGSIAAYKAAYLVRAFVKAGAQVRVIMTPAACEFISPLTLSTLSKHKVYTDVIDGDDWNNHVELGLWADMMLVAPATATTIAKMANGISDNILTAVYLSAKCPVFFAPAMDRDMWIHPSTQNNIRSLQSYGNTMIDVESGELASGLHGFGRMAEPESILSILHSYFERSQDLKGKNIMITAGPTKEAIDPVRFISNHSTGKMGIALARECAIRGANVQLILGPSTQFISHPHVQLVSVVSADQMMEACSKLHADQDICIFTAAVADYKPASPANQKIKKSTEDLSLKLVKNPDIAACLGKAKRPDQTHIGFALETSEGVDYAQSKLEKKNFDFIVLNTLQDRGAGFGLDTNKITILNKKGDKRSFELKSKSEVAVDIINTLVDNYVKS